MCGSRFRLVRERSRRRARSLVEHWRGLDGACELLVVAGGELPPSSELPFNVTPWQPIMSGIKQRILALRRRANTAPARVEGSESCDVESGRNLGLGVNDPTGGEAGVS